MSEPTDPIEVLGEGKFVRLVRKGRWEYATRKNASGVVGIVAVTDEGKLIMVEQYRPAVGRNVIELPAGIAGDLAGREGEAMEEAARRELLEETGYDAAEVAFVTDGVASAGITDELLSLCVARGLTKVSAGGGDASESIVVHEIALADVPRWLGEKVHAGRLLDFKIYAALWLAEHGYRGLA